MSRSADTSGSMASKPVPPARPNVRQTFRKFRHLSMMGRQRFIWNLTLTEAVNLDMRQHSVVECGVWKGGASFAMMDQFPECEEFHLFDSFEGLPDPTERDGQRAIDLSDGDLFIEERNYASYDEVIANAAAFGFTDRCAVHKGWFEDTVKAEAVTRPIGILRMDGDWYDSTMTILDRLYDSVAPGGIIIVDDYYDWPGCSQAVHDFLSKRQSPEALRSHNGAIAYIVKKPADFLARAAPPQEIARRAARNERQKAARDA